MWNVPGEPTAPRSEDGFEGCVVELVRANAAVVHDAVTYL